MGSIALRTGNPADTPLIDPNYLSDSGAEDLHLLIEGMKTVQCVARSPALRPYVGAPMIPEREPRTDPELEALIRQRAETMYHPVGTCRMGVDGMAVVDPQLRVRGLEALRVVNASVMPRIIRGHTNSPTIMIAERAADLIRGAAAE